MATLTEPPRLTGVLKQEYDQTYCREAVTILAGDGAERALQIGTVLGKITGGAVSDSAVTGNTGDGVIDTVAITGTPKPGQHTATCVLAATDAGLFEVRDPDGIVLGTAAVGELFVGGGLSFTIPAGTIDYAVGDALTITVAAGSGKVVALDLTATDGSAKVYGVLLTNTTAPDGADAAGVALVLGPAAVADAGLIYPAGITATEKAAVNAALEAKGIAIRKAV